MRHASLDQEQNGPAHCIDLDPWCNPGKRLTVPVALPRQSFHW
jgi:hypothetical protein